MAESAVAFVVKGIADLLKQEAQFLGGVSGQIEQLQKDLGRMQSFLKDADKRQDKDETVRGWVSEIREIAYDSEALLETFALKLELRNERGFYGKCKRYATIFINGSHVHQLGVDITNISGKIKNLAEHLQAHGIRSTRDDLEGSSNNGSRSMKQQQLQRSYSHLVIENTVGLTDDTNILLGQLLDDGPKKRQVVSICGMGGLGKTTLATQLYHHDAVRRKGKYDAFAWTCVSQQFQVKQVLEELLMKLSSSSGMPQKKKKIADMDDGELAKKLYHMQIETKCLVVLDDVWKVEDWGALKHAFPIGSITGMVLITTRNKALPIQVDTNVFIHELKTLSEDESWELLKQKLVHTTENEDLMNNEMMGREMLKSCSGLPLAINVLGNILARKRSLHDWNSAHENVNLYLKRGQEHSDINEVLAPSYYDLSYGLKSCFLHLSHFPEEYSIPCKRLYRLWIAEGIVTYLPNEVIGEETLEYRAEMYLRELIDMCVVQVCETGSTGKIKSCGLHDMMRGLSMLKANKENFFDVVHSDKKNETNDVRLAHRLAVYVKDEETIEISKYTDPLSLRSLILVNKVNNTSNMYYKENIVPFSVFQLLKVLSLRGCLVPKQSSKEIGQLIYLKYLGFEQCDIESLPPSIGNISYLQTLIVENRVDGKFTRTKIPNVIRKLKKLRHLRLSGVSKYENESSIRLDNLSEIQTLEIDDIMSFDIEDIKKSASSLKKFAIRLSNGYKVRQLVLGGEFLNQLSTLYVAFSDTETEQEVQQVFSRCHRLQKIKLEGKIEKLPPFENFPRCLAKLTLIASALVKDDPMAILEKLAELTTLSLDWAFQGRKMVCSSKGFPRLRTLSLHRLNELVEWQVDDGAMHNLHKLEIISCGRLKMVPDGIKFVTSLHSFVIGGMPIEFTSRVQIDQNGVQGEDYYKVLDGRADKFGVYLRRHACNITISTGGLVLS